MSNRSGLRYTFKITYTDGTELEITTSPIDAVVWRRRTPARRSPNSWTCRGCCGSAGNAGRRKKQVEESTFEKWVERIEDFDADEDEPGKGEPDPTNPDRLESSSPDSPSEPDGQPAT